MDSVLDFTIPQIKILEHNLYKICKAEAGKDESEESQPNANQIAFGATVKMLTERTGRKEFTIQEIMDPAGTIAKYKR